MYLHIHMSHFDLTHAVPPSPTAVTQSPGMTGGLNVVPPSPTVTQSPEMMEGVNVLAVVLAVAIPVVLLALLLLLVIGVVALRYYSVSR